MENESIINCLKKVKRINLTNTKFKNQKQLINEIIEFSMLKDKKDEIALNLTAIERLKLSIGLALLKLPNVILFSIPHGTLGRLEMTSFNQYLKKIIETFHVVIIVHGPKEIVSVCDKILTISDEKADSGTIDDLVLQIPQSGEVIEMELNNLNPDTLNKKVFSSIFEDAIIIEERQNEKFKIFSQENADDLIIKLMNIVGPYVYNFKRFKPSLAEYLEFRSITR
jgi:ABC-type multidrug transport system ATPase subunit